MNHTTPIAESFTDHHTRSANESSYWKEKSTVPVCVVHPLRRKRPRSPSLSSLNHVSASLATRPRFSSLDSVSDSVSLAEVRARWTQAIGCILDQDWQDQSLKPDATTAHQTIIIRLLD